MIDVPSGSCDTPSAIYLALDRNTNVHMICYTNTHELDRRPLGLKQLHTTAPHPSCSCLRHALDTGTLSASWTKTHKMV